MSFYISRNVSILVCVIDLILLFFKGTILLFNEMLKPTTYLVGIGLNNVLEKRKIHTSIFFISFVGLFIILNLIVKILNVFSILIP